MDLRWTELAIMLATPIGVVGYRLLEPRVMNGILAIVLAAAIQQPFASGIARRPWHSLWMGVPMGILSGLLTGVYGTGGPPTAAFVQSHHYERHRHVVSTQLLLAVGGTLRVMSLFVQQALTPEQWRINAIGIAVVPLGVWAGLRLFRSLPTFWLREAIFALLALSMVHCAVCSVA